MALEDQTGVASDIVPVTEVLARGCSEREVRARALRAIRWVREHLLCRHSRFPRSSPTPPITAMSGSPRRISV